MSDPGGTVATVHWVGTGLSTGSGLHGLAASTTPVVLWGRTARSAAECARRLELPERVTTRGFTAAALAAALAPGDVVVSMLPAAEHAAVASVCVEQGAHFACTSYTTAEIRALFEDPRAADLVVLTEAGLDPGIDHLLAHILVADARAELGDGPARVSLTSYCGGIPAVPDEFCYRFSWAPRGVLTALLSPARYVEAGAVRTAARPWEAVRNHLVDGEDFEVYPNRDSTGFVQQYGVPDGWEVDTFIRGTLRPPGWKQAWAQVFRTLIEGGAAAVDELAADLAARHPTTPADRDRVVLVTELQVSTPDGATWSGRYVLDEVGDADESAMARLVSRPVALGVRRILDADLPPGLHRGTENASGARAWLDDLARDGIPLRRDGAGLTGAGLTGDRV